jgi:hypothetical protein
MAPCDQGDHATNRAAGEKLFVDFAGDTAPVVDELTAEVRAADPLGWGAKGARLRQPAPPVSGRYEPGVTRLAAHYDTTVMPTWPHKQRDMVKVEVARSSRPGSPRPPSRCPSRQPLRKPPALSREATPHPETLSGRRRTRWPTTEMISSSMVAQCGAILLERHLDAGLPTCRPAELPMQSR